jgi:hypothetical protein
MERPLITALGTAIASVLEDMHGFQLNENGQTPVLFKIKSHRWAVFIYLITKTSYNWK